MKTIILATMIALTGCSDMFLLKNENIEQENKQREIIENKKQSIIITDTIYVFKTIKDLTGVWESIDTENIITIDYFEINQSIPSDSIYGELDIKGDYSVYNFVYYNDTLSIIFSDDTELKLIRHNNEY